MSRSNSKGMFEDCINASSAPIGFEQRECPWVLQKEGLGKATSRGYMRIVLKQELRSGEA